MCVSDRPLCPPSLSTALSDSVKACGAEALALLGQMKEQESLATADSAALRAALDGILATAEVSLYGHTCFVVIAIALFLM